MKSYRTSTLTYENGNVYVSGELYGTEDDFYTDRDEGRIEIIEDGECKNEYEPPEYDDDWDDWDDDIPDTGMSHSQQCWADRQDLAREMLERGDIDEEQADEIRHGA